MPPLIIEQNPKSANLSIAPDFHQIRHQSTTPCARIPYNTGSTILICNHFQTFHLSFISVIAHLTNHVNSARSPRVLNRKIAEFTWISRVSPGGWFSWMKSKWNLIRKINPINKRWKPQHFNLNQIILKGLKNIFQGCFVTRVRDNTEFCPQILCGLLTILLTIHSILLSLLSMYYCCI